MGQQGSISRSALQLSNLALGKEYLKQKHYKKSVACFRKGAETTCTQCQYYLSYMYTNGLGVKRNEQIGNEWLCKAAENGDIVAVSAIGDKYLKKGDFSQAYRYHRRAAEQGHALSQYNIGKMYEIGQGVQQSYENSLKWYTKASDLNFAQAQYEIAQFYYRGNGVDEQDYSKAIEWFLKSSENGFHSADCSIGSMYYNGEGLPQDYSKAIEWFTKAAERGNSQAQSNLGIIYAKGEGVGKVDPIKAMHWFLKAGKGGGFEMLLQSQKQICLLIRDYEEVLSEEFDWYFDEKKLKMIVNLKRKKKKKP